MIIVADIPDVIFLERKINTALALSMQLSTEHNTFFSQSTNVKEIRTFYFLLTGTSAALQRHTTGK